MPHMAGQKKKKKINKIKEYNRVYGQTKGKKADVAMLWSGKIEFKAKSITRDKEDHSIMIKGLLHQEHKTSTDFCEPN